LIGRSDWRRQRLLILCYHGVSIADEHVWNPSLFVSPATFARRMELLASNRIEVLELHDAIRRVYAGTLPGRAAVLTFDDGYFNFLVKAWPVLRRCGFPATVYLPTLRSEHNYPVLHPTASYMLWKRRDGVLRGNGVPGLQPRTYRLATATERQKVVSELSRFDEGWTMSPDEKDEQVRKLAEALGCDYDEVARERRFSLLTPDEVVGLVREGVDFELHTHRHRTPTDPAHFVREVEENREHLEAITGHPARHLCYPSGICHPGYTAALRAAGILSATTTRQGIVDREADPLYLPRFVDTEGTTEAEFEGWIHGLAPWLQDQARGVATRLSGPGAGEGGTRPRVSDR
jgi:peptidoglycan/xylan/chitin deacetylase (PgdA/CDA1 family)